jgi:hypothetical protein
MKSYVQAIKDYHRKWIENGTTLPLFNLACAEALKNDLLGTEAFRNRIFTYIPAYAERNNDRSKEIVISRFKEVFHGHEKVISGAEKILDSSKMPPNGRFSAWGLTAKKIPQTVLDLLIKSLQNNDPIESIKKILNKYKGKLPALQLAGFSQLCFLLRNDIFPVINKQCFIGPELLKSYGVSQKNYLKYPQLVVELGSFLDKIGFPQKFRYDYFDCYTGADSEECVQKNAHNYFHTEISKFLGGAIISAKSRKKKKEKILVFSAEGDKVISLHQGKERSPKNRNIFLATKKNPQICDVCNENMKEKYRLENLIIQVHHKMLLNERMTPCFEDLMGLCPNCHNALHYYLRQRLSGRKYFRNKLECERIHTAFKKKVSIIPTPKNFVFGGHRGKTL